MVDEIPDQARKGRGAVGNVTARYEPHQRVTTDDGWAMGDAETDPSAPIQTEVTTEHPKTVIATNSSPDIPFEQSINPYRGCEHGCIYCFARPTHAYQGLSPGLDFETKLFAKDNAPEVLAKQLRRKGYRCKPIMLGANTDPYQPIERDREITRGLLQVLSSFNHPVAITTKSALVLRDLDILRPMAEKNLVQVAVSLTTLEPRLTRTLEPRANSPAKRLAAMRTLARSGIPVTVMAAPMIPHVNDQELERILSAAKDNGATGAGYILLRLPMELKELFTDWLEAHAPNAKSRVLNAMKETRNGELYVSDFATRLTGTGQYAGLLAQRFHLACKKLRMDEKERTTLKLRTDLFRVPPQAGDQLALF